MTDKTCRLCQETKLTSFFYKRKCSSDGYRNECKACMLLAKKEHRESNLDIYKARNRANYIKNYDNIRAGINKYIKANPDLVREHKRRYDKKRSEVDPSYKLGRQLRCRLNSAIRGAAKNGSAVRDLGCSLDDFKVYIESKFVDNMSWDNYGFYGWHMDHIKPLALFDLTDREQLLKACHYTNIQPLWAEDNFKKGTVYVD